MDKDSGQHGDIDSDGGDSGSCGCGCGGDCRSGSGGSDVGGTLGVSGEGIQH